ncbi:MAG: hypothetical protein NUV57_02280 [archaeon]|nr:hypothetical protein [archaeon]
MMSEKSTTKKFTNFELVKWLSGISFKEFQNGKNLAELCSYEKISLWPSVISDMCVVLNNKQVYFKEPDETNKLGIIYKKLFFAEPLLDFGKKLFALSLYSIQIFKRKKKKHKVMFFSLPKAWRQVYSLNGSNRFGDVHYNSLIKEFSKEKYDVEPISVSPIMNFRDLYNPISMFKRALNPDNLLLPLEMFWSREVFMKKNSASKHFAEKWESIKKGDSKAGFFTYQSTDFSLKIFSQLGNFFTAHFANITRHTKWTDIRQPPSQPLPRW